MVGHLGKEAKKTLPPPQKNPINKYANIKSVLFSMFQFLWLIIHCMNYYVTQGIFTDIRIVQ